MCGALKVEAINLSKELEAIKPMNAENEFKAIEKNATGELVLENSRFKTRVRASAQTEIIMENAFGQRVVGRAVKADGKQTTIHLLK
ncbi:hypothetical protein EW026_g8157, partial [Hermanssonia centrifuga]